MIHFLASHPPTTSPNTLFQATEKFDPNFIKGNFMSVLNCSQLPEDPLEIPDPKQLLTNLERLTISFLDKEEMDYSMANFSRNAFRMILATSRFSLAEEYLRKIVASETPTKFRLAFLLGFLEAVTFMRPSKFSRQFQRLVLASEGHLVPMIQHEEKSFQVKQIVILGMVLDRQLTFVRLFNLPQSKSRLFLANYVANIPFLCQKPLALGKGLVQVHYFMSHQKYPIEIQLHENVEHMRRRVVHHAEQFAQLYGKPFAASEFESVPFGPPLIEAFLQSLILDSKDQWRRPQACMSSILGPLRIRTFEPFFRHFFRMFLEKMGRMESLNEAHDFLGLAITILKDPEDKKGIFRVLDLFRDSLAQPLSFYERMNLLILLEPLGFILGPPESPQNQQLRIRWRVTAEEENRVTRTVHSLFEGLATTKMSSSMLSKIRMAQLLKNTFGLYSAETFNSSDLLAAIWQDITKFESRAVGALEISTVVGLFETLDLDSNPQHQLRTRGFLLKVLKHLPNSEPWPAVYASQVAETQKRLASRFSQEVPAVKEIMGLLLQLQQGVAALDKKNRAI